jgi:hypothetical protein
LPNGFSEKIINLLFRCRFINTCQSANYDLFYCRQKAVSLIYSLVASSNCYFIVAT